MTIACLMTLYPYVLICTYIASTNFLQYRCNLTQYHCIRYQMPNNGIVVRVQPGCCCNVAVVMGCDCRHTAVHCAARCGCFSVLQLFANDGWSLEAKDDLQRSPAVWAHRNGHKECQRILANSKKWCQSHPDRISK